MEFMASWGWAALAVLFVIGLFAGGRRYRGNVIALFIVAAFVLYFFAGFNPQGTKLDAGMAFLAGVLFGGWGWILLIALLCAIFPLVELEQEAWAFVLVIASAVVVYFLLGWNVFTAILFHPFWSILAFAAYLAVGAGWSWFKWGRFVDKAIERMKEAQRTFIEEWSRTLTKDFEEQERIDAESRDGGQGHRYRHSDRRFDATWRNMPRDISPEDETALKRKVHDALKAGTIPDELLGDWLEHETSKKVSVFQNKERLVNWIMFWPWSLLSYFFFDLLREIFEEVWRRMVAVYQTVVDRKYAHVDQRLIRKPSFES